MRAIITSSSPQKLARARKLGAAYGVDYLAHPDWETEVLSITEGRGVDVTIDVTGGTSLSKSLMATRPGGSVAVTGALTGTATKVDVLSLLVHQKRLVALRGSREMLEKLCSFTEATGLHPIVDKLFPFAAAADAFEYIASGAHFGKVVVQLSD